MPEVLCPICLKKLLHVGQRDVTAHIRRCRAKQHFKKRRRPQDRYGRKD
jgi:DNA-binding MarR family transcriptional regulator